MNTTSLKPFKGKTALITGGSRGIGKAIALSLAERGAHIIFTYFRRRSDAESAEKEIVEKGITPLVVRGNMGNAEHVAQLFDEIKKHFHQLDFVVHNAATGDLKPVLELTDEEWARTIDINTTALLRLARSAAPLMAGRQGRFINISSHGADRVLPNYAAVGIAKAASEALIRYLAAELAPQGITANSLRPGTTDTLSLKGIPHYEQWIKDAAARTPAGRLGTPEDIARLVTFLCSEEGQWITGQSIVADGGRSLTI